MIRRITNTATSTKSFVKFMTFRTIDNPFSETHLVRLESDRVKGMFRPSAIDSELSIAREKASMEELEDIFSCEANIISSAAHPDLSTAIYNAQKEAIERISLSAWWAFERPVKSKLSQKEKLAIIDGILPKDGSFNVEIGFVEPSCATGYVAVSILESKIDWPRIVLGGSYDIEPMLAAKKAFLESVQSWTATNWLKDNDPSNMPYWDSQELLKRAQSIRASEPLAYVDEFSRRKFNIYFEDKPANIFEHGGAYAAGICARCPVEGLTYLIADLDRHPGESVSVFTQHNF